MTLTDFFFFVHAGSWIFIIGIGVKCELPVVKDYGGFLHLLAAIVFWLWSPNYLSDYHYTSLSNCFRGPFPVQSYKIRMGGFKKKKKFNVMYRLVQKPCSGMGSTFNSFWLNFYFEQSFTQLRQKL